MTEAKEKLLLAEAFAKVVIREDGIVSIKLKGFLKLDQMKKTSSAVHQAVAGTDKLKLLLIDQKELKVLSKDVQDHLIQAIVKLDAYILRVVVIKPDDPFALAGMNAVENIAHANKGRNFAHEGDAIEWLLRG